MKLQKSQVILLIIILNLVLLSACSSDKKTGRSMDSIHKEEGIPVKIEKIRKTDVTERFLYNAVLEGIEETSKYAMIGDRIERIYVNVGDYVSKDQPVITFPDDNPSAKFSQAKTAFENAGRLYERNKSLYEQGGISRQTLDNIKTQYEVAKADFEAAAQMVEVKSPIDGYITNIAVKETQNVKRDQLLFTVANTKNLKAKVDVSEMEIDKIKIGQKAYAEWKGKRIEGSVTRVAMSMNPTTKSFDTIAEFDNSKEGIKAGVTADVHILENGDERILVDRKNIITEGTAHYVYIEKNNTAVKTRIEINDSNKLDVVVEKGLKEGDKLITQGITLLSDGSKIKIIGEVE